jgi:sulfur carrier protein ThiS
MISVDVSYLGKKSRVSVKGSAKVGEILEKIGINKEAVIVRKGQEIVPDNESLKDRDRIEVLRIISGG